jgi:hypothetical protein
MSSVTGDAPEAGPPAAGAPDPANAPVVIGGLGGSGTRAVANVLRICGLTMTGPLNQEVDNEWVTMLFKRPRWLPLLLERKRPIPEVVQAFEVLRAMFSGQQLDSNQLSLLAQAAADCAILGYAAQEDLRWWAPPTPFKFVMQYLGNPPSPVGQRPWGWKEPVSHVVLPELIAAFPRVSYVHVVRDPLDMAWSSNTQGVRLWGALCGIDRAQIESSPANARLAWWLYSIRSTVARAQALGDRFMLVRFEHLCADPSAAVRRLAAFAGLEPDKARLDEAAKFVERPATIGRQHEHDLDSLDRTMLTEANFWTRYLDESGDSRADESAQAKRRRS